MSELPKGWKLSPISELADVQAGVGFPKKFQGVTSAKYPVYKVGDLSRAYLNDKALVDKAENYVSEEVAAELKGKIFKEGAILFAKIGEALRLNRRVKVVREGLADNNVMAVIPKDCVDDNYLFRFLQYYDVASLSRSTTVPSIRKGDVENVSVPHPELNEQKRIADKLDSVLAKVEAAQARLDKIPAILKRFRQSVLAAATSGELTKEWREGRAFNVNDEIKKIHVARLASFQADAEKHYEITGKNLRKYDFSDLNDQRPQREIPESWEIVPLGNLITFLTDYHANGSYEVLKKHVELKESEDYACMIRATNFEKKNFDDLMIYVNKDAYEFLSKSKLYGG